MTKANKIAIYIYFVSLIFTATTQATLIDRGSGLIYDADLDITWLADANYAMTSGYDADGRMSWSAALVWAQQLNYAGFTNWRLPTTLDPDPSCVERESIKGPYLYDCSGSEMGHLFYDELEGVPDIPNNYATFGPNLALFSNLQRYNYWSATEAVSGSVFPSCTVNCVWDFDYKNGVQTGYPENNSFYVLAVHDGDIGQSPPISLSSLTISGPTSVNESSNGQYIARANWSNGSTSTVTNSANWNENSPYATIGTQNGYLSTRLVSGNQSVTITASYTYGGINRSDTHVVTITDVPVQINVAVSGEGRVSSESMTIDCINYCETIQDLGDTVVFEAIADAAWVFDHWNGSSCNGSTSEYCQLNIVNTATITAVFLVDTDGDGIANNVDADDDNDGVIDPMDAFPLDASESLDTDNDGIGNNSDADDDNDGVIDPLDAFPLNASESLDTDNDGIGNNADADDDNDGVIDPLDAFPLDANESLDTDNDGIGNNADADDDNDGVIDPLDAFPLDVNESIDTDNNGIGNNADIDDDNDGVIDPLDAFPLDANESLDTDNDGIGNNADADDDNDGVIDPLDAFPLDVNESIDTDNDGIGNNADVDDDNDGIIDPLDDFPLDASESLDTDNDGIGNNIDADDDNDAVLDPVDAFPLDNSESIDTDNDAIGNNADTDDDNDGVDDAFDAFPLDATESADTDGDGIGDNSDAFPEDITEASDMDGDGTGDNADVFPTDPSEWLDTDSDGYGNNLDTDDDNDGIPDWVEQLVGLNSLDLNDALDDMDSDNFSNLVEYLSETDLNNALSKPELMFVVDPLNPRQSFDTDNDSITNDIDIDDDNDGIEDNLDVFPINSGEWYDSDNDRVGDNSDAFPNDATEWLDTDLDGAGNNTDVDDDNDGVDDAFDVFPLDTLESADTDQDGIGDNSDVFPEDATETSDMDGDGTGDNADVFPADPGEWLDTDSDGYGNNQDTDDDNDGIPDWVEQLVGLNSLDQNDALSDIDSDGFSNLVEYLSGTDLYNFYSKPKLILTVNAQNPRQSFDTDNDSITNDLDIDDDNDGMEDNLDVFPLDSGEWYDSDNDHLGDNSDAFPNDKTEWLDTDLDGVGNNADTDDDNDGVVDADDVYPLDPNRSSVDKSGSINIMMLLILLIISQVKKLNCKACDN